MLKVKNHKNLRKDPETGAIIDVDQTSYNKYMERKKIATDKNKRIQELEDKIEYLEMGMEKILKFIGENNGKES